MSEDDLYDYLLVAKRAARAAGALLLEGLGNVEHVEFKGAVDIVTEFDKAAEDRIVSIIQEVYPTHGILTEESSEQLSDTCFRWIIDPLDGTTNFAHGFPIFCVSIALEIKGVVMAGVVFDPTRDELFCAIKSCGATLNDLPINVSDTRELNGSLLATGFPYDLRVSDENNLKEFAAFAVRAQAIRRAGSAAIDLCYVASGRFDGFWELKLKPWDIAAGTLIVEEAGGRVSDYSGSHSGIDNKLLLATNGLIHQEMMAVLNGF